MRLALLLILPCILPVLALLFDISSLGYGVGEQSATEFLQSLSLLLAILCLIALAIKNSLLRHVAIIMAFLGVIAFIREQDAYFDIIYHGAWLPFALMVLALILIVGVKKFAQIYSGAQIIIASKPFPILIFGAFFVLIQSRVFGTSKVWKQVLNVDQVQMVKTIIQEGLELTGYLIILVAVFEIWKTFKNSPNP